MAVLFEFRAWLWLNDIEGNEVEDSDDVDDEDEDDAVESEGEEVMRDGELYKEEEEEWLISCVNLDAELFVVVDDDEVWFWLVFLVCFWWFVCEFLLAEEFVSGFFGLFDDDGECECLKSLPSFFY